MHRKTLQGLFGILGIWLTAGFALPFVNILDAFTPEQLMVFRGFITAAIAFVLLRGAIIERVDKYTYWMAGTVPFATWGLFQGIRHWGAGPTLIVIAATPIVNVAIGVWLGRRISLVSILGLTLVISGITMALWGGRFQWIGFAWSLFATVVAGAVNEWLFRAKATPLQRCFWGSVGMGTLGLVVALGTDASWTPVADLGMMKLLLGFALVGGFLYWLSYLLAFDNLPPTEASILAQGETLAVIVFASFLLGEHLTAFQWAGVGVALVGASCLVYWLCKQPAVEER